MRDTHEDKSISLQLYEQLRELPEQGEEMLQSVLHGIGLRDYKQVSPRLLDSFGISPSTISRQFVEASRKAVEQFMSRPLSDHRFVALFLDGKHLAGQQMMIAMGITNTAQKIILSVCQSTTENSTAIKQMPAEMIERGFSFEEGLLCVIDGSRGIRKAIEETWGNQAVVQRCQWHKRENVVSYLSESQQEYYRKKLQTTYQMSDYDKAKAELMKIADKLKKMNQQSYHSLMEGLEETLTLHYLKLKEDFGKSMSTTNCIESVNSQLTKYIRKVKRWMDSEQRYRWVICGLLEIERKLHHINGYKRLYSDNYRNAIASHIKSLNQISTKNAT